ncbi:RIP metalloprotease RseP [Weissella diestrammenae]|uniref:Zinc metalloprotease n=1 Tax=Weissella diestrammenae TaxID=1162633 RepID=A0A7G9T3X3_9LACO|nr:RIP metalloprotease RseP [Weissella diestrammenae]MCM0582124.1 RIP metalloprotease RseP [Weissella diestrammenae]QNN74798.1 RIP metalloprotease RseP [Weissella diestrammenae]
MTGIIAFIIVFAVVVFIHELGHFMVAKWSGVRVREFAIGMGPKVVQLRRNGTTYTLRLLPLGGYVRMAGRGDIDAPEIQPGMTIVIVPEDNQVKRISLSSEMALIGGMAVTVDQADLVDALEIHGYLENDDTKRLTWSVDPDATMIEPNGTEVIIAPRATHLESASAWQRLLINFAGPLMNFILAVVLFFGLAFAMPSVTTTTVDQAQKNSPAYQAGIQHNDRITKLDGHQINNWQSMQTYIQTTTKNQVAVTFVRQGVVKTATVKVKKMTDQGQKYQMIGITARQSTSAADRVQYGIHTAGQAFTQIFHSIKDLIIRPDINKLGGPVSIFKTTSDVSSLGVLAVVSFMAWLSVNLGLINLFPIPALDGGKIVLNVIEILIRRPIPEKVENYVTAFGAVLLVILMIAVTWNDIARIFLR